MDDNHITIPPFGYSVEKAEILKKKTVPEMLQESANIYKQRAEVYGDNYKQFGNVMTALFPAGLELKSKDDWNRLGVFIQKISKVTRYVNNWNSGGHDDSLMDDAVYTTMLRELDKAIDEIPF